MHTWHLGPVTGQDVAVCIFVVAVSVTAKLVLKKFVDFLFCLSGFHFLACVDTSEEESFLKALKQGVVS